MRDKADETRYTRVEWIALVCVGHKPGNEAAPSANNAQLIQARGTRCSFASGCVKRLQLTYRAADLHIIKVLCTALATIAINTYRAPVRIFGKGVKSLFLLRVLLKAIL